jgi:carbamoyl-phosphate synthase large subunit
MAWPRVVSLVWARRLLGCFDVGVRRVEDLAAYQLAVQFKLAVYEIVRAHGAAEGDLRYRDQLFDAASSGEANIAEGFARFGAREFRRFLGYARASLVEATTRVQDGVHRGHFRQAECADALALGDRAIGAITALHRSLGPFTSPKPSPSPRRDRR